MSNEKKNGGPAFPEGESYVSTDLAGNSTSHKKGPLRPGMTLRDYFAAKAMELPDLLPDCKLVDAAHEAGMTPEEYQANGYQGYRALLAKRAYQMADAMLKAREL